MSSSRVSDHKEENLPRSLTLKQWDHLPPRSSLSGPKEPGAGRRQNYSQRRNNKSSRLSCSLFICEKCSGSAHVGINNKPNKLHGGCHGKGKDL